VNSGITKEQQQRLTQQGTDGKDRLVALVLKGRGRHGPGSLSVYFPMVCILTLLPFEAQLLKLLHFAIQA